MNEQEGSKGPSFLGRLPLDIIIKRKYNNYMSAITQTINGNKP